MPQAIPAIGAAWAAIGAMGIAGAIIQGAIIGAAVGGLTAAVTGGNIGKGLLFGAVGGAVMGGLSGVLGGTSSSVASTSVSMNENVAAAAAQSGSGISSATTGAVTSVPKSSAFEIGKMFSTQGGGTMGAALITTAGSTLAGAFDDTAEKQMKLEREKMAMADKQFYANLAAQKEIAGMKSGGGGGGYDPTNVEMAKLAEQRRQFDKQMSIEEAKKQTQQASLGGLKAAKEAGVLSYEGVDTAIYNKNKPVYQQEEEEPYIQGQGVLANA